MLQFVFCGFISHVIGHETIDIPEIFSGGHGFTGKTVNTLDSVSSAIQTPLIFVENTWLCIVFSSLFSEFDISIKDPLS